ncbi:MAG: hypothetical protein RBU23_13520 [Candidatus Auribacterota bacterium]|nr:hypothetical protein [Candidatus Auribacterota bacterium]
MCEAVRTIYPVKDFREENLSWYRQTMEELGSTGMVNECELLINVVT